MKLNIYILKGVGTKEVGEEDSRLFKSSNLSIEFMSTVLVDAAHHPIRELYSVHVGEDFR